MADFELYKGNVKKLSEQLENAYVMARMGNDGEGAFNAIDLLAEHKMIDLSDERLSPKAIKMYGIDTEGMAAKDFVAQYKIRLSNRDTAPNAYMEMPFCLALGAKSVGHAVKRVEHGYEGMTSAPSMSYPVNCYRMSWRKNAESKVEEFIGEIKDREAAGNIAKELEAKIQSGFVTVYSIEVDQARACLKREIGFAAVECDGDSLSIKLFASKESMKTNHFEESNIRNELTGVFKTEICSTYKEKYPNGKVATSFIN